MEETGDEISCIAEDDLHIDIGRCLDDRIQIIIATQIHADLPPQPHSILSAV